MAAVLQAFTELAPSGYSLRCQLQAESKSTHHNQAEMEAVVISLTISYYYDSILICLDKLSYIDSLRKP